MSGASEARGRKAEAVNNASATARSHQEMTAALLIGATLWCLAILAAPVLHLPFVYAFFSRICHQDPSRSWRLFGEPLPVCIRCTSIYFAFTISLWVGLKPNARWLRASLAIMAAEFIIARTVLDAGLLRSLSGILVGLSAAPFVRQGVEELRDVV